MFILRTFLLQILLVTNYSSDADGTIQVHIHFHHKIKSCCISLLKYSYDDIIAEITHYEKNPNCFSTEERGMIQMELQVFTREAIFYVLIGNKNVLPGQELDEIPESITVRVRDSFSIGETLQHPNQLRQVKLANAFTGDFYNLSEIWVFTEDYDGFEKDIADALQHQQSNKITLMHDEKILDDTNYMSVFLNEVSIPTIKVTLTDIPKYWPENREWPLEDGTTIVQELQTYPPKYKLSNGEIVQGVLNA